MDRDSYEPGTPSWVDLGTSDIDGAAAFYSGLFGWECVSAGPAEETGGYRMFFYKERPVAGLGPQMNPGPPYWTTYVSVADADETIVKVKAAGGTVFVEPMDVLDVGRMAVFADPTGAVISIWQPKAHIGAGIVSEPNSLCWNELSTRDEAAATAFYEAVFGWKANVQGGDGMRYTEWQLNGQPIGGMMKMPAEAPEAVPNHWLAYFAVNDCDDAVATVQKLGGSLQMPPMDIEPGRFALVIDPQGAMFAVIKLKDSLAS
jgi:hypothetical protein